MLSMRTNRYPPWFFFPSCMASVLSKWANQKSPSVDRNWEKQNDPLGEWFPGSSVSSITTIGAEVPGAGDPSASLSLSQNTIREGTGFFSSGTAAQSGLSITTLRLTLLTLRIRVQFCLETERTNSDVSGDPQQEVPRGRFEWFLELHYFTRAYVGVERTRRQPYEGTKAIELGLAGSMQELRPMFVLLVCRGLRRIVLADVAVSAPERGGWGMTAKRRPRYRYACSPRSFGA